MKIKKARVAPSDLIHQFLPASYSEVFEIKIVSNAKVTPDDIMVDFWTEMPGWINFLFNLRNWLVKPFGLKGAEDDMHEKEKLIECIRNGRQNKLMGVAAKSEDETVLSLTDKHLTAYIGVRINKSDDDSKQIRVSTIVQFHNTLGKVYFLVISPFHFIIVTSKIKSTLRKLFRLN